MGNKGSKPAYIDDHAMQIFNQFVDKYCIVGNELTCFTNYWEFCQIFSKYLECLQDEKIRYFIQCQIRRRIGHNDWFVYTLNLLDEMVKANHITRIGSSCNIQEPPLIIGICFRRNIT
jgi:hypothetical protein